MSDYVISDYVPCPHHGMGVVASPHVTGLCLACSSNGVEGLVPAAYAVEFCLIWSWGKDVWDVEKLIRLSKLIALRKRHGIRCETVEGLEPEFSRYHAW